MVSNLFSKGHPLTCEPGLFLALDIRKRDIIERIKSITDLGQMTDSFCEQLVKDALVEPLVLHFDQITRKTRTEEIDASLFPGDFFVERGRHYLKTVVRVSLPFSGDRGLLQYSPRTAGLTFPRGEVSGNTIRFDILMWGHPDDADRVKHELDSNLRLLDTCAANVSKQVKEFNEGMASEVKAAFAAKLDELTKQHAILDDIGIPEKAEPTSLHTSPAPRRLKRGGIRLKRRIGRANRIFTNVMALLVRTLTQFHNNTGDV